MIKPIVERRNVAIECVDIMDEPQAEARYAESIPVLARSDRSTPLCWPFDTAGIYRYLL